MHIWLILIVYSNHNVVVKKKKKSYIRIFSSVYFFFKAHIDGWHTDSPPLICSSFFPHLDLGIFSNSSLQICSRYVKLDGECQRTAIFKSFHRFSMGIKSVLWLGHSRNFMFLFWSHSSVALAVCLGSLSCWNVNLHRSLGSFALWSRFSSRICLYLAPFILTSSLYPYKSPSPCC